MYIVTNQIEVKKGFAEKMAVRFTSNPQLKEMPGFHRVEVSLVEGGQKDTEFMHVSTWWASQDDFENWKNSDAFKQAHQRPKSSESNASSESPVVGNNVVKSRVLSSLGTLE
ncbi:heme oxygenase [Staphylococcus simulans]|uniref:heme oxygenase n=1 Tax=Staphylococcus simulans TaxID=1286 RepID=UPI000CD10A49|nr:heme oxygenase [Staphylococcus simulans]PNZ46550.1 heme-degrading monooxygenase IsdG [Staphylococcus simulans]SQE73633.1 heme-degrading monooxygenase IsdG [Staphylococcus simulans]